MSKSLRLNDLLSIDVLQKVQDNFSEATGFAMVAVDACGEPVTKPSGFSSFCLAVRSSPVGQAKCSECDNAGGRKAMQAGGPTVYCCGCGLAEFAVPITVEGHYLGALLSGQTKIAEQDAQAIDYIVGEDRFWQQDEQLVALYQAIQTVPFRKFEAAAYSLYHMTRHLVEQEYANAMQIELHEQKLALLHESKRRAELEKSLQEAELQALSYQINPHFLFNVLNTIGRLALLEGAEKTEAMVYGFSDMMRYILKKNNNQLITIQSELAHVTHYLSLQQVRMGDKFSFDIVVPEQYYAISCPFMVIQPIVENSFNYAVEPRDEYTHISIRGFDNGHDVILEISDNGEGIAPDIIEAALDGNLKKNRRNGLGIFNVSNRLKLNFGEDYGLEIASPVCNDRGAMVRIRCPMTQVIQSVS